MEKLENLNAGTHTYAHFFYGKIDGEIDVERAMTFMLDFMFNLP